MGWEEICVGQLLGGKPEDMDWQKPTELQRQMQVPHLGQNNPIWQGRLVAGWLESSFAQKDPAFLKDKLQVSQQHVCAGVKAYQTVFFLFVCFYPLFNTCEHRTRELCSLGILCRIPSRIPSRGHYDDLDNYDGMDNMVGEKEYLIVVYGF